MEICAECLLFGPHGYSTLFHPGTLTCMDQAENHFALRLLARQPLAYRGGNSRVKKREEEVRHLCTSLLPTGSLRLTVSFFWKLPVTLQTLSLSLSAVSLAWEQYGSLMSLPMFLTLPCSFTEVKPTPLQTVPLLNSPYCPALIDNR